MRDPRTMPCGNFPQLSARFLNIFFEADRRDDSREPSRDSGTPKGPSLTDLAPPIF